MHVARNGRGPCLYLEVRGSNGGRNAEGDLMIALETHWHKMRTMRDKLARELFGIAERQVVDTLN